MNNFQPSQTQTTPTGAATCAPTRTVTVAAHDYFTALGARRPAKWKSIVGLILLPIIFVLLSTVFTVAALGIDFALGNQPSGLQKLAVTPVMLAGSLLGLVVLNPASRGLQRLLYGLPGGTLSSLTGRFRWDLVGRYALAMVIIYAIGSGISLTLFGPEIYGTRGPITGRVLVTGLICLVLMPFQAAGEEYLFRGLGNRLIGSWFRSPRVAVVVGGLVTSVFFSLAHAAADWWLIVYYFVVGAALTYVTWRTGGLEAAVVIHGLNNVASSVVGTVLGLNPDSMFERGAGTGGPFMLIHMGVFVLAALVCAEIARRQGVTREIPAATLVAPARA